jgi:hypothetical protein
LPSSSIESAPLDLFGHEADADEDGDEEAEDARRREAEILDDLDVLPRRQLPQEE